MIDFDVETTGLQWPYHRAFLYQFGDGDGNVYLYDPQDPEARPWIQAWFNLAKIEGIEAWNTKFDWHFAANDGFDLPPEEMWHDGMVRAHVIDETQSVALKMVGTRLLGEGSDDLQKQVKGWLTKERARRAKEAKAAGEEIVEPNYSDVPTDLMNQYAAEDIVLTRSIRNILLPRIQQATDLTEIYNFEMKTMGALWHAERRGFPARRDHYEELAPEVEANIERLHDKIFEVAGLEPDADFNPGSSQQLYKKLKELGADLTFVTNESMDKENLETVEHPLAEAVLDWRSEMKVLSTYVKPMITSTYVTAMRSWKEPFIAPDGRIHANYRQVGARTGRMSCSDPNLQNQPRDDLRLRYNFVAPEGYKLVTVDLSNIEARLFAAYAGEGEILRAIRAGDDVYVTTAEAMGLRDRPRAGGGVTTARQLGKGYFLSKIYGAGLRSVRKQLRCDMQTARMYNRRYDDAFPEVRRLQNKISWALDDRGFVKSGWGRRMRGSGDDAYKFTNYLVQGTAADLLKESLIRCHAEGIPIIACVHDELIALVPDHEAEEARDFMIHAMTDYPKYQEMVPLEAEGDIVVHWSDNKPLKDEAGRPYLFTPQWAGGEKRYL